MKKFKQYQIPEGYNWQKAVKKPLVLNVAEILNERIWIESPEGVLCGEPGDYVVEDFESNQFIHRKDIFSISYEILTKIPEFSIFYAIDFIPDKVKYNFFKVRRKTLTVDFMIMDEDFKIQQENDIMYGKKGDIIILTPNTNHFYRIYPDIFKETYFIGENLK